MGGFSTLGGGTSWEQIKQKLETEGAKNKSYDSDVDGVIDKLPLLSFVNFKVYSEYSTSSGDNPRNLYATGNYLYWCLHRATRLVIFDISERYNPKKVSDLSLDYNPLNIDGKGDYIYVGGSNGLHIYDISNPTNPTEVGTLSLGTYIHGFYFDKVNDIIYACCHIADKLSVIDVSDPTAPTEIGSLTDSTNLNGIHDCVLDPDNNLLYVTNYRPDSSGVALAVIDVSNPTSLSILYTYLNGRKRSYITKYGNYLLVGSHINDSKLIIVDATDPSSISVVREFLDYGNAGYWVAIKDNRAIVTLIDHVYYGAGKADGLAIINMDNLSIEQIIPAPFTDNLHIYARHLLIYDNYLYASTQLYDGSNYIPRLDVWKLRW